MKLHINGTVLEKGSEPYEEARQKGFAVNGHHSYPAIIAKPATIEAIQDCIRYANAEGLTMTVRSGGHNWFGSFLRDDVLLLDMSSFDEFTIDAENKEATVGPCTSGAALSEAAEAHGLHFPVGHCDGVPMGGYLLGGGLGWLFEHFGIACDYVLSAQVVTPDGDLITITDEQHGEDWMYLLRGAASAFPGVVVSFQLKLLKMSPILRSAFLFYPKSAFDPISTYLQKERSEGNISDQLEITIILGNRPPPLVEVIPDEQVCILMINGVADSEEEFSNKTAFLQSEAFTATQPYFPSPFKDTTISAMGKEFTYPAGLNWMSRHYFVETTTVPPYAQLLQTFEEAKDTRCMLFSSFTTKPLELQNPGVVCIPGCLVGSECRYTEEEKENG